MPNDYELEWFIYIPPLKMVMTVFFFSLSRWLTRIIGMTIGIIVGVIRRMIVEDINDSW